MVILCTGNSRTKLCGNLSDFILKSLHSRSVPILVTGEEGFPYHSYYQRGKFLGLTQSVLGKLLVCQSVNMYHLRDIIQGIDTEMKKGAYPILVNFSSNYLDENVPAKVSDFLHGEDVISLKRLSQKYRLPVFFWESDWLLDTSRRSYLQRSLYNHSSCVLDWNKEQPELVKNILTNNERGLLYGNSDSGILHISGELIQRMERIPKLAS